VGAAETLGGAREDHLDRTDWILPHIAVPDAKYGPTLFSQPLIPQQITLRFCMLAAIDFDYKLRLSAREISNVRTDRELPRELGAIARKQLPHLSLFPRRV
jgi:hypothetical protein